MIYIDAAFVHSAQQISVQSLAVARTDEEEIRQPKSNGACI